MYAHPLIATELARDRVRSLRGAAALRHTRRAAAKQSQPKRGGLVALKPRTI